MAKQVDRKIKMKFRLLTAFSIFNKIYTLDLKELFYEGVNQSYQKLNNVTLGQKLTIERPFYDHLLRGLDNLAVDIEHTCGKSIPRRRYRRTGKVAPEFRCDGIYKVRSANEQIILPPPKKRKNCSINMYTTQLGKIPFQKSCHTPESNQNNNLQPDFILNFDLTQPRQTIHGFGGAVTDAVTINLENLKNQGQGLDRTLMDLYFNGPISAEYNIVRVPIASTDFSLRQYTYLDQEDDFELKSFSLQPEDDLKIKWLKYITSRSKTKFLATSWTAPKWLKTNHKYSGYGTIKGKPGDIYHQTWAKYYVKFFQKYAEKGVKFSYLTTQNEPNHGSVWPGMWQTTGFTWRHMRDFIKKDLGPILDQAGLLKCPNRPDGLQLITLDDVRIFVYQAENIVKDIEVSKYVDGVGIHWYRNGMSPLSSLDHLHQVLQPRGKFILATEACHEKSPLPLYDLGTEEGKKTEWKRAVKYSKDILLNLNHHVTGWLDWNLCLDTQGGPNWVENYTDAPILVEKDGSAFYVKPMFFHMTHFSKLLPRNSKIYWSELSTSPSSKDKLTAERVKNSKSPPKYLKNIYHTVATRPDSSILLTFLNENEARATVFVQNLNYTVTLPEKSIISLIYYL